MAVTNPYTSALIKPGPHQAIGDHISELKGKNDLIDKLVKDLDNYNLIDLSKKKILS